MIIEAPRRQKLGKAADLIESHIDETLTFYAFPDSDWLKIRTNNPLVRIMKEIRRRTRVAAPTTEITKNSQSTAKPAPKPQSIISLTAMSSLAMSASG
ncbi:hypothetical protein ATN84_16660 [Paramesorhizobium deserti]|uniref:Mutator family transposase n=1 Tax=Paramesorhizobium deserti TaxID=1494590 RepID=A0A135HR12_9HYPH|nr:hypothetical protein ATN84_16660 [Paramesorhizobium deserti]